MLKRLNVLPLVAAVCLLATPVALFAYASAPPELTIAAPFPSPAGAPLPVEWLILPALAGALNVKDTGTIAAKFVRNAQAAAGDYKTGVQSAGPAWEAGARAGEDNYATGVQQAIADKRFGKGIAAAGASKYVTMASEKGSTRFGPGVAASQGEYARGAQPYLDALKGITLPPRRPKGDPSNYARAQAVGDRLRAVKLGK